MDNLYKSNLAKITNIIEETPDVKTFRLEFLSQELQKSFTFKAGQFGLFGVLGEGESAFCIASSPTRSGCIECSVKKSGRVTSAIHNLEVGQIIVFRGPYGNSFPIQLMTGKNIVFIAGGIGLAPVRSIIWNCLDMRKDFKDLTIIYGSRSASELVYKYELKQWAKMPGIRLIQTIDPGSETRDWSGQVGFVPTIVKQAAPCSKNSIAIVCGPPIMIKLTIPALCELGFGPDDIITTLENKMKCGIGKCGRCNVGNVYICKEGPVFAYSQLKQMPQEF